MSAKTGQLDVISAKILHNLLDNGPRSSRQVSGDIKISHQTVNAKVKRLERLGLVRGYLTDVDLIKLGNIVQDICVKCGTFSAKKADKIVKAVVTRPEVCYFKQTKGAYDFIITTAAQDIETLYKLEQGLREKISDHTEITRWNTSLVMKEHKVSPSSRIFGENKYNGKHRHLPKVDTLSFKRFGLLKHRDNKKAKR